MHIIGFIVKEIIILIAAVLAFGTGWVWYEARKEKTKQKGFSAICMVVIAFCVAVAAMAVCF